MIFDFLSPSFLYTLAKDALKTIRGLPKVTPEQKIESRAKWKSAFEAEVSKNYHESLRKDVIIRDVKRYDQYPEVDGKKKGISPWFRLALLDTYHDGILVWLNFFELVKLGEGRYRLADWRNNERGELKVILGGKIPYYAIESVDLDGDEYYYFPQIFCHFAFKGEPYESLDYYVEHEPRDMPPYYVKVASYGEVRKATRSAGFKP